MSGSSTVSDLGSAGSPPGMLVHEMRLWERGLTSIAGIDEAGRGPLAGPVVASAVVLPRGFFHAGVDDSKRLSQAKREELYQVIRDNALAVGIGIVDHLTIDRVNILNATFQAMHDAVGALPRKPEFLLVDGNRFRGGETPFAVIVHGDAQSISIAAASIIAKVTRDRIMEQCDLEYPGYGFARHKGYGTPQHRDAITRLGLCPIHRRSFTRRLLAGRCEIGHWKDAF